MKDSFAKVMERIGDPLDERTLYGPLHSQQAVTKYQETISEIKNAGGTIEYGGEVSLLSLFYKIYVLYK